MITGGSSGLGLASAQLFVAEGAYVFITGRRQDTLDEAVGLIGRNVTGVQGDAANLGDLDRLFDTVKRETVWLALGACEYLPLKLALRLNPTGRELRLAEGGRVRIRET